MSTGRSEDEAWRSIVENYGDRPRLDEPEPEPAPDPRAEPLREPTPEPDDDERFVPPTPPPPPSLPLPKRLAWLGVLGSPAVLLVATLAGLALPPLVGYALLAGFVGGFVYLVSTMDRGGGRPPWDDGSRV